MGEKLFPPICAGPRLAAVQRCGSGQSQAPLSQCPCSLWAARLRMIVAKRWSSTQAWPVTRRTGSLIAAVVALWNRGQRPTPRPTATSSRPCQASGSRPDHSCQVGKTASYWTVHPDSWHRVKNRRTDRIFDLKVTKFVMDGEEIADLQIDSIDLYPTTNDRLLWPQQLLDLAIAPDQILTIFPKMQPGTPDLPADYVSVDCTDSSGHRWHVDTAGKVRRNI
jgi:hypothetical protein